MAFEIPLAEQKIKPHQVTALHLMIGFALLAAGAFILFVFSSMMLMPFRWDEIAKDSTVNMHSILWPEYIMMAAGLTILFISLLKNKWLLKPGNNKIIRVVELALCAVIAGYSLYTNAMVLAGMFGILSLAIIYSFYAENTGGAANRSGDRRKWYQLTNERTPKAYQLGGNGESIITARHANY